MREPAFHAPRRESDGGARRERAEQPAGKQAKPEAEQNKDTRSGREEARPREAETGGWAGSKGWG